MMDILMSETCWVHKKWNKIASDIKLVFYSSTITMMQLPINTSFEFCLNNLQRNTSFETTRKFVKIHHCHWIITLFCCYRKTWQGQHWHASRSASGAEEAAWDIISSISLLPLDLWALSSVKLRPRGGQTVRGTPAPRCRMAMWWCHHEGLSSLKGAVRRLNKWKF